MKVSTLFATLLLSSLGASALAATPEQQLLSNIKSAQTSLESSENIILKQRQKVASELNSLEQEVLALRDKTAVARRLADERTLSLSQLENRLKSWREQQVYQQNLLDRFLKLQGSDNSQLKQASLSDKIDNVNSISQQMLTRFQPQWQVSKIALLDGEVTQLPTLRVGPVNWYLNEAQQVAGVASNDKDGFLRAQVDLSSGASADMQALRAEGKGNIVFDPTLGRALTLAQTEETLVDHVVKGGLWVVPILLFALFATVIALLKSAQLWRLPKLTLLPAFELADAVARGQRTLADKFTGMQKTLVQIALESRSDKERDDRLFVALQQQKQVLERWLTAIAITASVSPLLGLLGTVSGMIETFKMMTSFGSSDPEVVSGGIAQALVTTELGLVVAIPALILSALLSRKAKGYYHNLENFAVLLSGDESASDAAKAAAEKSVNKSKVVRHNSEAVPA